MSYIFSFTFTDPVTYEQFFKFWAAMFLYGFGVGILLKFIVRAFSNIM